MDALVARLKPGALALYLYHIPQNTNVPWPVEIVATPAKQHAGLVVGIKDSSGDLAYSRGVVKAVPGFDVFPSSEATLCDAPREGFAGCISATTNLTAGDAQVAWRLQGSEEGRIAVVRAAAQRSVLAQEALVSSLKAALALRYDDPEWARTCPPLQARTPAQRQALASALEKGGWKISVQAA